MPNTVSTLVSDTDHDTSAYGQRQQRRKSNPSSPIQTIDPLVRALNTIMFGMVVHFGTFHLINFLKNGADYKSCSAEASPHLQENQEDARTSHSQPWLWSVLLFHEYWVFLQHCNVLANPLCQRLDRQYGIALLKSNEHWAIAGTLSAYWCRESLGMFLCLPYLVQQGEISWTAYGVLYSLIYHTVKSRGVRRDAIERYSPPFGIMRVVIDKFYLHTAAETALSLARLLLQGVDTGIHFFIVRSLTAGGEDESMPPLKGQMHVIFTIWVLHAALNQYFRCSTASLMVQAWHCLTARVSGKKRRHSDDLPRPQLEVSLKETPEDESTDAESVSGSEDEESDHYRDTRGGVDEDFVVRRLLRKGRVADELKGRQGAASRGVDTAVRLETCIAILSLLFLVGLGEAPFYGLRAFDNGDFHFELSVNRLATALLPFGWCLWSILLGIWATFLRSRSQNSTKPRLKSRSVRRRTLLNFAEICISAMYISQTTEPAASILLLIATVTLKSFLNASPSEYSGSVNRSFLGAEVLAKLTILRVIAQRARHDRVDDIPILSLTISFFWMIWIVSRKHTSPCEVLVETKKSNRSVPGPTDADVVFLGHPAELSDCWALWLLPYPLQQRWQPPVWALPLWPLHYLVGEYVCSYRRKLFGDRGSFFLADHVEFIRSTNASTAQGHSNTIRVQNWVASHFGRHFVTHPQEVKLNIEAAARFAEDNTNIQVFCLGALNKAESINGGGFGVAHALDRSKAGSRRRMSIIHGNHLTAAAVVETTHQCVGEKPGTRIFLTGASSKVGWAVVQALRDRYDYDILCHSTDIGRRKLFQEHGFKATSKLSDGACFSKIWIVGKYDPRVASLVPQNGTGIVFAVPHPLQGRPDLSIIEAGTLHIDKSRLDRPRQFTNKLCSQEIFACHTASIIAAHRLRLNPDVHRLDETGPVDPITMDSWLDDAKDLGFVVPSAPTVDTQLTAQTNEAEVIVIGGGPAGLSVAASLARHEISTIVLEAQESRLGSWCNHFHNLEVTTQSKWCSLPGLPLTDALRKELGMGEYPNAQQYQSYLDLYAARFDLDLRRGCAVDDLVKGKSAGSMPWTVKCSLLDSGERLALSGSVVVCATGKHRVPSRNTSDDVVSRLTEAGIPWAHTTDFKRSNATLWNHAIDAATLGRLTVVGAGNSAADIITMLLVESKNRINSSRESCSSPKACVHWAARTVPPVFPRARGVFRVDTLGWIVRKLPSYIQDLIVHILWRCLSSSRRIDKSFPAHLSRWGRIRGRVPIIDKYNCIDNAFGSGEIIGRGPISQVIPNVEDQRKQNGKGMLVFDDIPVSDCCECKLVPTDFVLLATGYETANGLVSRQDRLNGLYTCGFQGDQLLPLLSIGEESQRVVREILTNLRN